MGNPLATALRRALVPQGMRDAVKRRLQIRERPPLPDALVRRLEDEFAEDYARLHALLPGQHHVAASYSFVPA